MLRKIAVLNSKTYGKAELKLDDCDSLQIVGPNNIGKSTIIYALNFLFIVDGQKMTFSGQRKGDKETIHHYFPTPNQSYIIFEIFKKDFYCVLVKRNTEGELEYYKYDAQYTEDMFYVKDKETGIQRLLKFDEFQENLAAQGLELYQFRNKSEVFNTVYQRGTRNQAAVWLEDSVKADGLSNNFSKVYRYLINSKLINNKTLKESLIIADNRENETLNFSQKNKRDIVDLLKLNEDIKNIKGMKTEFLELRELVHSHKSQSNVIAELVYAFNHGYSVTLPELETRVTQRTKDISTIISELNEIHKPKEQEVNRKIGQKEAEINNQTRHFVELRKELEEINSYETMEFLTESLTNLDRKRKEIETKLTTIEQQNLSSTQLENKVENLEHTIDRLENQFINYKNLLIHAVSDNPEHKKIINSILSEQVLSLPADQVKEKIKKVSDVLAIFDGKIDISEGIELKPFKSIETIKDELDAVRHEKSVNEKLLAVIKNSEKTQMDLNRILSEIENAKDKIRRLNTKPAVEKQTRESENILEALKAEKDMYERELKALMKEISRLEIHLNNLQEDRRTAEERIKELKQQKLEVETFAVTPIKYETDEPLEAIYTKLGNYFEERSELKHKKDRMFDDLRNRLKSDIASEDEFITYFEEEIACLTDKEKSIDGLLQSISTQFSNPAYTLLKRYEEFKQFVYDKFNEKLRKTRISDLSELKLELIDNKKILDELRMISQIQDINGQMSFDFGQSESLRILNLYLDNGKKVSFEELFDIELQLMKKGELKKVDLGGQVESDGTDRMIRLIIVMNIINRLAIDNEENRIALFIDEVATIDKQNRPELVRFCQEHNFIPIFAAPDPVPGFHKYYFIYPSKGKININEKVNAVFNEPNGTNEPKKVKA